MKKKIVERMVLFYHADNRNRIKLCNLLRSNIIKIIKKHVNLYVLLGENFTHTYIYIYIYIFYY